MCKVKRYSKTSNTQIDKCLRTFFIYLDWVIDKDKFEIMASCCGHGKYPMTIIFRDKGTGVTGEMFSGREIKRKRNFYKRDKQGYYYIPEVQNQVMKGGRKWKTNKKQGSTKRKLS